MVRPSLALGTGGAIFYDRTSTGWRARCYVRDHDGRRRQVERWRKSKAAAAKALSEALRDRARIPGGDKDVTADTRLRVVAEAWYATLEGLSTNTMQAYRDRLNRQVIPSLGELRLREVTPGASDRFLRAVADNHGPSTAKMCRTVLSGVLGYATRQDAIETNVVRETGTIKRGKPKRLARALTVAQAKQMRALVTYDPVAVRRDIPDLLSFVMGSGTRIGEACAVVWDAVDLDLGIVEIRATAVRIKGIGVVLQPEPKSDAGYRKLALPKWCVAMLKARYHGQGPLEVVFPSQTGKIRDGSNTQADIREALDRAGFAGWTTHLLGRKSAATRLDEDGHSGRQIADFLGHSQVSMSMDNYVGRKVANPGAAETLEILGF